MTPPADAIVAASNGADVGKMQQIPRWRHRSGCAPAHGDDVDPEASGPGSQARGEREQCGLQPVEAVAVDEPFRGRVIGPGLDLDRDPGAAAAHQQVDLRESRAEIARFDAEAGASQSRCGQFFAALTGPARGRPGGAPRRGPR